MSRRYLIIASIAAHGVVAAGLFISGVWKLERLEYRHRASLTLGAMLPPGESGGGEGDEKKEPEKKKAEKKKREKTKVDLANVDKIEKKTDDEPTEVASTGGGGGEGEGEGPDIGPATGGGGGGSCDPLLDPDQCQGPPVVPTHACGNGIVEASEQCDDGNLTSGDKCSASCKIEQVLIPPGIFQGMRISGETQIVPPDPVKTQIMREGKDRTLGSFKLCIDTSGSVSSISPISNGTKYPAYDAKITTAMRAWRYRPYMITNQGTTTAVPACSVVTFVYTIK